jgi:hypothetical protein
VADQPNLPDVRPVRASDADRERVAEILHAATVEGRLTAAELDERLHQAYAAKTLAELEPLTVDLPDAGRPRVPDRRIGGSPGPTTSIALMSGFERKGTWAVPPTHRAVAIMGGGTLDLREARFAEAETTIYAFALMGGIEIKVPEDITVHVEGVGLMGGFEDKAGADAGPGSPVVRVRGFALMGGVAVTHGRHPRRQHPRRLPR